MRVLVAVVLLGGCLGVGSNGGSRPGVMPLLSELPADATKRDTVLDSASTAAGPEQRQGMTGKERAAETAAATAAAVLGTLFSHTRSVTLGTSTRFDASQLVAPQPVRPPRPSSEGTNAARPDAPAAGAAGAPAADDPGPSNADLIPWIKLK